jgi:hypothetical protein
MLLIGDVAGTGIPAGFVAARVRAGIRLMAQEDRSPAYSMAAGAEVLARKWPKPGRNRARRYGRYRGKAFNLLHVSGHPVDGGVAALPELVGCHVMAP